MHGPVVLLYLNMKTAATIFKLFSDVTRLRTLMLLGRAELCVCQIMGVLGVSQPLVSRNLAMLEGAGLLDERRSGKLVFYKLKKHLPEPQATLIKVVKGLTRDDEVFVIDINSLTDCMDYQKKAGSCDMKTFLAFMKKQRAKAGRKA